MKSITTLFVEGMIIKEIEMDPIIDNLKKGEILSLDKEKRKVHGSIGVNNKHERFRFTNNRWQPL